MNSRRDAPGSDGDRIRELGAKSIHQPAYKGKRSHRAKLENGGEIAIVRVGPAKLLFEQRLQDGDHLAVDIIENAACDDEQKQ